MRVLGVDPSLASTGLALVEAGRVLRTERVRTKLKGHERVGMIVSTILGYWDPDGLVVGIEGPAMGAKGSAVVQIFGLWGVITHELWKHDIPYYVVTPGGRVKYGTGNGRSSKDEVLAAVVKRYPDVDVTGNDVADALVIAAMGARHYGEPLESSMPKANLAAMDGVQWVS